MLDLVLVLRQRSLEQLEEKMSTLKKDLVTIKESLNQAMLEKEVLESAKEGLSGALSKVRMVMGALAKGFCTLFCCLYCRSV